MLTALFHINKLEINVLMQWEWMALLFLEGNLIMVFVHVMQNHKIRNIMP